MENVWCFLANKSRIRNLISGIKSSMRTMFVEGVTFCPQEESMTRGRKISSGIFLLSVILVLSACSSKKPEDTAELSKQDSTAIGQEESLDSRSIGIMEGRTTGPMLPVYFGYDRSSIRPDQVPRMKVNSDFLKDNEGIRIRIEGNCDPRGTREYNLALGEKRALVAKKYLVNVGIAADRISTVSLGEEKILIHGHDEMSWAQNRRDDFIVEK